MKIIRKENTVKIIRKRTLGVSRSTMKLSDVYELDGEVFMKVQKENGNEVFEVNLERGTVRSPVGSAAVQKMDVTLVENGSESQGNSETENGEERAREALEHVRRVMAVVQTGESYQLEAIQAVLKDYPEKEQQ